MSYDKGLSSSGEIVTARAQEIPPLVSDHQRSKPLPPTSPTYGYFHPISQNIMFTAPPGSRFVLAPNANLSVTIFQAKNLQLDGTHKFNPFVRAIQGEYKYMTSTASTEHPVWNETFKFPVLSPIQELLILELWDDKAFGKNLLGYLPIDLSLLPRGIEVVTWERLSYSPQGEISIGITANGFGLETLPDDYGRHYEDWRPTIPSVNRDTPISKKNNHIPGEAEGPYGGKCVPEGYVVDNGNVKRVPSTMSKAFGRAKNLFSGKAAQ